MKEFRIVNMSVKCTPLYERPEYLNVSESQLEGCQVFVFRRPNQTLLTSPSVPYRSLSPIFLTTEPLHRPDPFIRTVAPSLSKNNNFPLFAVFLPLRDLRRNAPNGSNDKHGFGLRPVACSVGWKEQCGSRVTSQGASPCALGKLPLHRHSRMCAKQSVAL